VWGGGGGEVCGVSENGYNCAHGAQINFREPTPMQIPVGPFDGACARYTSLGLEVELELLEAVRDGVQRLEPRIQIRLQLLLNSHHR
jgi:hypothetical protein